MEVYINYNGSVEKDLFTDIFKKVLQKHGIVINKEIGQELWLAVEDFFNENQ
jgi:hypothetical protein